MYFWLLILLIVCAILCAVGFYKFVYFLSIGYGFAVAGGGIAIFIISLANGWLNSTPMLIFAIAQMLLFVAYGARLSGFLLYRELKSAQYRKTLKEVTNDEKKMPIFVLIVVLCWVQVVRFKL